MVLSRFTQRRLGRSLPEHLSFHSFQGISQDDLAYDADISRSYLSQIEKGVFHASLRIVGRLAISLKVDPAELLKSPSRKVRIGKP